MILLMIEYFKSYWRWFFVLWCSCFVLFRGDRILLRVVVKGSGFFWEEVCFGIGNEFDDVFFIV